MQIYMYIICICVCVCVYIYIYIYILNIHNAYANVFIGMPTDLNYLIFEVMKISITAVNLYPFSIFNLGFKLDLKIKITL